MLPPTSATDTSVAEHITRLIAGAIVWKIEFVGPQAGKELRETARGYRSREQWQCATPR